MKIYPHIMLKKGDNILVPWVAEMFVSVVDLIDWRLWVEFHSNRFSAPRGFYLKKENFFVPLF